MKNESNILVHTCCAPCILSINQFLNENKANYSGFFYNPNIHPYKEYIRRLDTLSKIMAEKNIKLYHQPSFMQDYWEKNGKNCTSCYQRRLEGTAAYAKENGFTHFTSTLLISPYQNHEKIIEISKLMEEKYNVEFFYHDFRQYFRESQKLAKESEIYRQKYCGCICSLAESKFKEKIDWE